MKQITCSNCHNDNCSASSEKSDVCVRCATTRPVEALQNNDNQDNNHA